MIYEDVCDKGMYKSGNECVDQQPQPPKSCPQTKFPIHLASGTKLLEETAYAGTGPFPLSLTLRYESANPTNTVKRTNGWSNFGGLGSRNLNYAIACPAKQPTPAELADPNFVLACLQPDPVDEIPRNARAVAPGNGWRIGSHHDVIERPDRQSALVSRPDGSAVLFTRSGGEWITAANVVDKLSRIESTTGLTRGWIYTVKNGNVERYDIFGRVESVTNRQGLRHAYAYDAHGRLQMITDSFGRQLGLGYDAKDRLETLTDPDQKVTTYSYDEANNLKTVTYADGYTKTFLFENADFPNALTGVIDENGKRFITYTYDAQGRARLEELAGGADRTEMIYGVDGNSTTVIDALGTSRTTTFATIFGAKRPTGQSQPGGSGCSAASNGISYDANGNVATETDFNGNITKHGYDLVRNLRTSTTEAFGTTLARTTTTEWEPNFTLPKRIAAPKLRTTFQYYPDGKLLSKTEQATTDVSGSQAFSAVLTGSPRTWTTTYNTNGQVHTITGPRTDIAQVVSYTYYPDGNVQTYTNQAGHVTTMSNYDGNGRVGRIVAPNGVITDLTYKPRGWLASRAERAATGPGLITTYEYDGVGQLKEITMPGGAKVTYYYDDAHRLESIVDGRGNSIVYTLDALGNRKVEKVTDPTGVLARQITRDYDALNRLKEQTGAQQ